MYLLSGNKRTLLSAAVLALISFSVHANNITFEFSGTTSTKMGSILAGTSFTGTFTYDPSVIGTTTAYYGGTKTLFSNAYSALTLTIGGNTVTEGAPGTMALFDNVSPPHSIPVGDSLYSFDPLSGRGPQSSSGSFNGLTPNFIYLGFVDNSGTAFSSTTLPTSLNRSSFNSAFVGINYGPYGAGNTTTISSISTITPIAPVPELESYVLLTLGIAVVGWTVRRRHDRRA